MRSPTGIGTELMAGVCLVILWYNAGISLWWLAGFVVLGWIINAIPFMRTLTKIAKLTHAKTMADFERRVRESAEKEAEEASKTRPLYSVGHKERIN
jgi:hypothetical protein